MYDSVTARDIPGGAQLVAGYADGRFAWTDGDWALFPNIPHVRIAINTETLDAEVIDIEPGNNDAAGSVAWVRGKWARGETPTVYCLTDLGPEGFRISDVRAACDAAGVPSPLFLVAHYDNIATIPEGCIGKQYANPTFTGGHYDASVVADFWPGIDREGAVAFKDDPDAQAYVKEVAATFDAIKEIQAQQAFDLSGIKSALTGLAGSVSAVNNALEALRNLLRGA